MIKNKGYPYSKNNIMSLVIKEGWNGLLLGNLNEWLRDEDI